MTSPLHTMRIRHHDRIWIARQWQSTWPGRAPVPFWNLTPAEPPVPSHAEYKAARRAFEKMLAERERA